MDETTSDEAWKQKVQRVDDRLRAVLRDQPEKGKKPSKQDRKPSPEKSPQPGRLPPVLENPL